MVSSPVFIFGELGNRASIRGHTTKGDNYRTSGLSTSLINLVRPFLTTPVTPYFNRTTYGLGESLHLSSKHSQLQRLFW